MQLKLENKNAGYLLLLFQFTATFLCLSLAYGEEQEHKLHTLFARHSKEPPSFSVMDINWNGTNELVVSEDGYLNIYEWSREKFVEKWKSSQYSYVLSSSDKRVKPITINFVSSVYPIRYKHGNNIKKSFLFSAQQSSRKTDFYELSFHDGRYDAQRKVALPSGLSPRKICNDQMTVFFGQRLKDDTKQMALYDWNGKEMIEKWLGQHGIGLAISGKLNVISAVPKDVILFVGDQNVILYCENNQYKTKAIGKIFGIPSQKFNPSDSVIGITKQGSLGELWTIETSDLEDSFFYRLYMAQYIGSGFSPFGEVKIKGINSDRVSAINIFDIDNDGIGEVIGSEVIGTLARPEEGEGFELKNERSYLFVAKWNGKNYEIMWRRQAAADTTLQRISVDDATGDGQKDIIASGYSITRNIFSVYVFQMPKVGK